MLRAPEIAAGSVVLVGCLVVGFEARDGTFTGDEWDFTFARALALASVTGLAGTPATESPYLVSTTYGRVLAVAVVGLLVLQLIRGRRVPPLAWAGSATAVALWTAACLYRCPQPQPISAGPYLSAVRSFGSAADNPYDIRKRPEPVRQAADVVLAHAERLTLEPVGKRPTWDVACRWANTGSDLGEIAVHPGTLYVRVRHGSRAELQLRRFAAGYGACASAAYLPHLPGRDCRTAEPGPWRCRDRLDASWRVRVVGRPGGAAVRHIGEP
jgi:hypothetical protein